MARGDSRSLAGGAVVETRLCARLLGIRLLVIDGAVTLWPAQPECSDRDVVLPVSWADVDPPPPVLPGPSTAVPIGRPADGALGSRLDATAERLDASTHRLQQLRAARSPG